MLRLQYERDRHQERLREFENDLLVMMVSVMSWNVLVMIDVTVSTAMIVSVRMTLMSFVVEIASTSSNDRCDERRHEHNDKETQIIDELHFDNLWFLDSCDL